MLLAVVACDRQDKQARPQNDQIGREMVFPEGIVYTRFLKDTIDYQIPDDADYNYLYTNSEHLIRVIRA